MNIEYSLFYKANKEFYVDVFFSWFFRQANIKKWKLDVIDFINDLVPAKINKKHDICIQTDRQYEKVDLWVEIFIKNENRLIVLIIENKLHANESRENQLEYYYKRAKEYYKDQQSRDNFEKNFCLNASYKKPEIYGVYLKLDYDFEKKLSETNARLFMCDVEKVYKFFRNHFIKVSMRESEILHDFTQWIINKYEAEIKKYLVVNLNKINNEFLTKNIYRYQLIKKIFGLGNVIDAYRDEDKYEIRKFSIDNFIKIGDSSGNPWVQYTFGQRKNKWSVFYRLEKRKEAYLDLTYYRNSALNRTHKKNIETIIDKANLDLSTLGELRKIRNNNPQENKIMSFVISKETNLILLSKKLNKFNKNLLKLLK